MNTAREAEEEEAKSSASPSSPSSSSAPSLVEQERIALEILKRNAVQNGTSSSSSSAAGGVSSSVPAVEEEEGSNSGRGMDRKGHAREDLLRLSPEVQADLLQKMYQELTQLRLQHAGVKRGGKLGQEAEAEDEDDDDDGRRRGGDARHRKLQYREFLRGVLADEVVNVVEQAELKRQRDRHKITEAEHAAVSRIPIPCPSVVVLSFSRVLSCFSLFVFFFFFSFSPFFFLSFFIFFFFGFLS